MTLLSTMKLTLSHPLLLSLLIAPAAVFGSFSAENDAKRHRELRMDKLRDLVRGTLQTPPTFHKEEKTSASYMFEKAIHLDDTDWTASLFKTTKRRRDLQETTSCTLANVTAGTCNLSDYCAEIDMEDPTVDVTCDGEIVGLWDLVSTTKEMCVYFSKGSGNPAPFDEALYDADVDVCFRVVGTLTFEQSSPAAHTQAYEFTRPTAGVITETYALVNCDNPTLDILDGYCERCTWAEVRDQICNGCGQCPDGSAGGKLLDCSNISPDLVTSCETETDDVFIPFGAYLGSICTYDSLIAEKCSLDKFCKQFGTAERGLHDIECSGDIAGEWSINLKYDEVCFYDPTDPDDKPSPFDQTLFDESSGAHCTETSIELSFRGRTAISESFAETFTRPMDSRGSYGAKSDLAPCSDGSKPDYDFGGPICVEDCGDLTVGGKECTSGE